LAYKGELRAADSEEIDAPQVDWQETIVGDRLIDVDDGLAGALAKEAKRPRTRRHRRMNGWLALLLACAVGCLISELARAVWAAREAARRAQCACNYCQILLALNNYHDTWNAFPPAYVADASGKPMHSWRVLILPFVEQSNLYAQYDLSEPWNGPHNIKLQGSMPTIFACPSRFSDPTNLTSYVAITGPGTLFPGAGSAKIADVTDGTANTLMVVEVANLEVPWTAPLDLDVRTMSLRINDPKRPGISSKHPGGANVGFADGSTRFAWDSISPGNLRSLMTIAGGEGIAANQLWPKD
jgi:prepilin-type processing-associated H-X9-DG protein